MSKWNRDAEREEQRIPTTAGKTENFATRNVRLITFLVCIGVFLAMFIPVGVMGIQNFLDSLEPDTGLPAMTLDDVIRLSDQDGMVTFSQITCFDGERSEWPSRGEIHYTVEIGDYILVAVADQWYEKLQFLEFSKKDSDAHVDVLTEDVREFLKKN